MKSAGSARRLQNIVSRFLSFLFNAVFAGLVAGAALPGPHRVAIAETFGLTEIAPRVWTDAPEQAPELLVLVNSSRKRVIDFFGNIPPRPTLVLCTQHSCARAFGIGGNGLSVADLAILASPGGLSVGTLTHEMTHARLHRSMGLRNILNQPYPTWFDEGLATHVANHPRWSGRVTDLARQRVRDVRHFWQWDDAHRELGVGLSYRAAAAEVAAIEIKAGRAGLLDLIARAEKGEDFDAALSALPER